MNLEAELKRLSGLIDALIIRDTGWSDPQKDQYYAAHKIVYNRRAELNRTEEIRVLKEKINDLEFHGNISRSID